MNPDTRSISVEWLENGETKGKEVRNLSPNQVTEYCINSSCFLKIVYRLI